MRGPDTLAPLPGEAQIPSLAPRTPGNQLKPFVAAGVLLLSLMAVLGFAATRYLSDPKPQTSDTATEVATAAAPRVVFKDSLLPAPAALPSESRDPAVQAIALARQNRVPSIEADPASPAQAIAVRGQPSGQPGRVSVPVGDESPFSAAGSGAGAAGSAYGAADAGLAAPGGAGAAGGPADAQANLRRYQAQLGSMLGQLQSLTERATGVGGAERALSLPAAQAGAAGAAAAAVPALFGSMERSSPPLVAATLMANRSLTMPKGVLFTCSLKTRIITAASGFVACQVQRNVFSDDGRVVLAERGSHLDGEYRIVQVRPGVTRIPVLWTRLRTPHGVTVDLDSPGTGALGESGIGGYVDNRWPERLGAALLVSLIDDAIKIVASDTNPTTGNTTVLLPSTTAAGSKLAEKVLEATITIPPLLYQNQGSVVGVYVARDVDFSGVYALEPR